MNGNLLNQLLVTSTFVSLALIAAVPAIASESLKTFDLQSPETGISDATLLAPVANNSVATNLPLESVVSSPGEQPVETQTALQGNTLDQPVKLNTTVQAGVTQPVESDAVQPASSETLAPSVLNQVAEYNRTGSGNSIATTANPMAQLTSVTQLSDVQPTDWAYQALQSLVERYGCIVGYPDGTYKGQRALTRFEFAAGMNACLDRISELLASATADLATKEDLATLQRLQEEFAAELAALRSRVDVLDGRVANLEANQFSTTTKLNGETIFALADAFGGVESSNTTIFGYRTRLAFDTSFSGSDRLRARLQVGDILNWNTTDNGETVLGNEGRLGFVANTDSQFQLDILSYLFPIGDNITVMLAPQLPDFTDYDIINPVSPFVSGGRGAISRFGRYNPIYRTATGSGAAVSFNFDFASLQLAYLAGEAGSPSLGSGLFNGDYGALAQVTLKPVSALTLAFTYINSYAGSSSSGTAIGFNTGTGSLRSQVRVGDTPIVANSYGAELNFQVAKFLQIGGWVGYSAVRAIETGDANVWNYAGTIAFPDLGKKGSLLGFVVGMEPRLAGTTGFEVNDRRSDPNAGLHIEGFYRFQLNDNISITPGVIWLTAPNNDADNSDVIVGAIRTTFTF